MKSAFNSISLTNITPQEIINIETNEEAVKRLIAAISHVPDPNMPHAADKIQEMATKIKILRNPNNIDILDLQINTNIIRHKENFNKLLNGVLIYASNNFKNSSKEPLELIQEILQKNKFFDICDEYQTNVRLCTWGSHRGSNPEHLNSNMRIAEANTKINKIIQATGGGAEAMKMPLKGSFLADISLPRIGFNEPEIVFVEPPNKYVNNLIIAPNINIRKVCMIGTAQGLQQLEGGVGTMEELMDFLQILLHDNNKGMPYLYDIVLHDEEYKQVLFDFLNSFLTQAQLEKFIDFHFKPKPHNFANHMKQKIKKQLPEKKDAWNPDMYFPENTLQMENTFEADFHSILSNLDLTKNQSQQDLLKNIGKFFHYFVSLTIKVPEQVESWKGDYPTIKIDPQIKTSLENLIHLFRKQGRIHLKGDLFYKFQEIPVSK